MRELAGQRVRCENGSHETATHADKPGDDGIDLRCHIHWLAPSDMGLTYPRNANGKPKEVNDEILCGMRFRFVRSVLGIFPFGDEVAIVDLPGMKIATKEF